MFEFGDIVNFPFGPHTFTAMVVCPGTQHGILTTEGTMANRDRYVVVVLDHDGWKPIGADANIWTLKGTSSVESAVGLERIA